MLKMLSSFLTFYIFLVMIYQTTVLIVILLVFPISLAQTGFVPGLYIDKVSLWSQNGVVNGPIGGYLFNHPWKYNLPSIQSAGLGLYNFQLGPYKMLSYTVQLGATTTTSTKISIFQTVPIAGIAYIAFSVVVITEDNSYIELLTLQQDHSVITSPATFLVTSTKFTFGANNPHIVRFIQWLYAKDIGDYGSIWYQTNILTTPIGSTNQIRISFTVDNRFLGANKVNVLLVAQSIYNQTVSEYFYEASTGLQCMHIFTPDFGVMVGDYGAPVDGSRCLVGINSLELTRYKYKADVPYFLFTFNAGSITNISSLIVSCLSIQVACFKYQCLFRSYDDTSYSCRSCNYDCYTCDNHTHCLSCNQQTDYRSFNNLTLRCNPIAGYFQNNITVSGICEDRTFTDPVIFQCSNCSYDCFTCDNDTHCLSCNQSTDYRVFNNQTFRCDPLTGYFQSGITVSEKCPTGCINCLNLTVCIECHPNYFKIQTVSGMYCITCSSLGLVRAANGDCVCEIGTLIQGICVEIVGCVDIIKELNGFVTCIACNTSLFKAVPVNNICECINGGIFINGICSTIEGCPAVTTSLSGELYCLRCNITQHYNPIPDASGQCVCQNKYILIDGICQDICGDGFLMRNTGSNCDDGNLLQLDGCSSTCQVETSYRCQNGSITTPSLCIYVGIPLSVGLATTKNTEGLNTAVFEFQVYPPLFNINRMDLYHYVSFECNSTYSIPEMTYALGTLLITADYTEDMEGRLCNITVSYNHSFIHSESSNFSFVVESDDNPLIYRSNFQQYQTFKFIFRILAFVALGIFVVSLPLKMAGVELMACCQMVYLSLCFYSTPMNLINPIKQFSPVSGFWSLLSTNEDKDLIKGFTDRMEVSPFFLESSLIITSILLLSALAVLVIVVVTFGRKGQERVLLNGNDNSHFLDNRAVKLVYHFLLFPFTVGFLIILLLEGYLNNRRLPVTSQSFFPLWLNSFGLIFMWFMVAVICGTQFIAPRQALFFEKEKEMKSYYPSIFIGKLMILSLLIIVGIGVSFDIILYAIFILELIFLALLVFTRVYLSIFMKLVAITCQTTVIYALSLPLLMRFYVPSEQQQIFLVLVLQGMIVLVELMTVIRVIIGYCRLIAPKPNKNEVEQNVGKKVRKKRGRRFNDPLINNAIEVNINPFNPLMNDNGNLDMSPQLRIEGKRRLAEVESQELRAQKERLMKSFSKYKQKRNLK